MDEVATMPGKLLILILIVLGGLRPKAQTVGVIDYTDEVQSGYVLFAPTSTGDVFLIDECGQQVNMWEVDGKAGLMGRLATDGSLLYTRKQPSSVFNGGGIGGSLISYDWEGNFLYSIPLADTDFHQHHDFVIMPNGNVLVVGWEYITADEAKAQGRAIVNEAGLWSETVREINPNNGIEPEIVWEWRVWDHLVQDADETLPNFGSIVDHPHRIDINFSNPSPETQDWLHVNALDYNENLDQIIVNCRNFSEFWVIDHSTTTEEAAGSEGGNAGKGGDVLYRWGNPETYDAGTEADRVFYAQHDAHWIPDDLSDGGKIMVFNNGLGRPEGLYSSIDIVSPIMDGLEYALEGKKFAPSEPEVVYGQPEGQEQFMFSSRISGSQRLRNGNTLICVGQSANFIEVNEDKDIVWDYVNPAGVFITTQGDIPSNANNVFQAIKYYYDFEGFEGKDMTPGDKIEINPIDNCDLVLSIEDMANNQIQVQAYLVNNEIIFKNPDRLTLDYRIVDIMGRVIDVSKRSFHADLTVAMNASFAGIYIVQLIHQDQVVYTNKLINVYE